MIVIAILGVLTTVALPAYNGYTKKAKFASIIAMAAPIMRSIELCVQLGSPLGSCTTDNAHIATTINENSHNQYLERVRYFGNRSWSGKNQRCLDADTDPEICALIAAGTDHSVMLLDLVGNEEVDDVVIKWQAVQIANGNFVWKIHPLGSSCLAVGYC